jgi:oligopeptide transport system substrate-binding protein
MFEKMVRQSGWLFVCLVLCFASCGPKEKSGAKARPLRISFNANPMTVDPRKNYDLITSTFIFMMYEGLTKTQPNGETSLALAKSYEISADRKTYTFYLKNASWSDGTPITSYDFEYSWKSQLDPKFPAPCKHLLYCVKNAEKVSKGELPLESLGIFAPDSSTLVVELDFPAPHFLSITSFCNLYPVPKHIASKIPDWELKKKLITSGPFLLKKWNKNQDISLIKNQAYWDAENVSLSGVHVSIITDENTALQMYENNELDWIGTPVSPLPQEALQQLAEAKNINRYPVAGSILLMYNLKKSLFENHHLRTAFSLAMNRTDIVKNISRQDETIATRCLPPALMKGKNKTIIEDNQTEIARVHLEAGLKELKMTKEDLEKIRLIYRFPVHKNIAQALQKQWEKALGITVKIEACGVKILMDKLEREDFDITLFSWVAQVNDPLSVLDLFKFAENPINYSGWQNQDFIHLLDQSSQVVNAEERMDMIEEAEKKFLLDFPIAPIYHFNYSTLSKPNVHDIRICPIGTIQFYRAWISNDDAP